MSRKSIRLPNNAPLVKWRFLELKVATRWYAIIVGSTFVIPAIRPLMDMSILGQQRLLMSFLQPSYFNKVVVQFLLWWTNYLVLFEGMEHVYFFQSKRFSNGKSEWMFASWWVRFRLNFLLITARHAQVVVSLMRRSATNIQLHNCLLEFVASLQLGIS